MGRFTMNGKAVMLNEKFVEYNNGALSLYVRGDHFPYSNYEPPNPSTQNYNNSYFLALSSESNTATVDYGDGNVVNYTFKSNQLLFTASTITENTTTQSRHNYANTIEGDRLIRIRFGKPDKIYSIKTQYVSLYGEFPSEVSNLKSLSEIVVNQSNLTKIPVSMASLPSLKKLTLSAIGTAISNRIPDEFLSLKLENFICAASVNFSDVNASNLVNFLNSQNATTLKYLKIDSCNMTSMPDEITNLAVLEEFHFGSLNLFERMPGQINSLTSLKFLNPAAGITVAPYFKYWSSVENLINLTTISCGFASNLETYLPEGLKSCTKLKVLTIMGTYDTKVRIDEFINNFYDFILANASKSGANTLPFRGITLDCRGGSSTGTFQQPAGYISGSSDGAPITPRERLWLLVNQYGHTITYTA